MTQNANIDIQRVSQFKDLPSDQDITRWVLSALSDKSEHAEVCVRLVDEPEIQALNETYRGKNKPTNVLSFTVDIPSEIETDLLGDIVICAPVVYAESQMQNKQYHDHFAHMIIHGCLHLLGYDHTTDEQADIMEPLEVTLLNKMNIDNP